MTVRGKLREKKTRKIENHYYEFGARKQNLERNENECEMRAQKQFRR